MRIPIKVAKDVAVANNLRQVILLAWDGELTHVVTHGKSTEDCAQAAAAGNMLKQKWGWPECNDQPSRVRKLENEVKELRAQLDGIRESATDGREIPEWLAERLSLCEEGKEK